MSNAHTITCAPVRLSALDWIALQALALWPHGAYLVTRALDGSDDPLGLLALVAAVALVARQARVLRLQPRLPHLATGIGLALAANAAWVFGAPALAANAVAAIALAAAIGAWWPARQPLGPIAALLLLALPLVASLQFYIGWPLRVVTAELSGAVLQAVGIEAVRSGATLQVEGRLVIVDAPCSGVQMAWLAYAAASVVAAARALRDGSFVRRLPIVGATVLVGNVVRNSVLVALEARPQGLAPAAHEAIGLVCLALVCATACGVMAFASRGREVRHATTMV